ncbi:dTDP-glucose 4,6-dehydratase [compost metagenome]
MTELGWKPKHSFETGIKETIAWYLENREWWTRIQSGVYQEYYAKQYGERLGDQK